MTKEQFYEKALRHIAGFTATEECEGVRTPMPPHRMLMWAQEFASEALNGIDPATGLDAELEDGGAV